MAEFAANCTYLKEANQLNIPNCISLYRAFDGCTSLEKTGIINSKRVKDFSYMFNGDSELKDVDYIDFSAAENTYGMFNGCVSLTRVKIIHGSLTTSLSLKNTKLTIEAVKQLLTDAGNGNGNEINIQNDLIRI